MLVPVIRKITQEKKILVERALPSEGSIKVKKGSKVEPFDRLGECMYAQNELKLPEGFKPQKFKDKSKYYRSGFLIGRCGKEKIKASYNGTLFKLEGGKYSFFEEEKRYVLLSGVWGVVTSLLQNKSVLIETKVRDMLFVASTKGVASGELVVLPNPSEVLKKSYLEKFAKGIKGKVVYIGHFADEEIVKRARDLGAVAVIAGSATRETFNFAKARGIALGLISGFGKINTPTNVFKALEGVSYRYVFFQGGQNILRIPIPFDEVQTLVEEKQPTGVPVKNLEQNSKVWVFQQGYFGKIGLVDRISESSILVKFQKGKGAEEINLPNFFIIE